MDDGDAGADVLSTMIDHVYTSQYTSLLAGVVVSALLVFIDDLDIVQSREFWAATILVLLATLLIYESNPTLPFMLSALVIGLAWGREKRLNKITRLA